MTLIWNFLEGCEIHVWAGMLKMATLRAAVFRCCVLNRNNKWSIMTCSSYFVKDIRMTKNVWFWSFLIWSFLISITWFDHIFTIRLSFIKHEKKVMIHRLSFFYSVLCSSQGQLALWSILNPRTFTYQVGQGKDGDLVRQWVDRFEIGVVWHWTVCPQLCKYKSNSENRRRLSVIQLFLTPRHGNEKT